MNGLKAPISVQYEITRRCPHDCLHCYNHYRDSNARRIDEVSELDWDNCKIVLQKIVDAGIFSVILTGGEPFMRRNILFQSIKFLKQAGIKVSINSSIILFKKDDIIKMEELGVDSILVSCPSMDKDLYEHIVQKNSFKLFLSKMNLLANSKLRFTVNMVVSNLNYNNVEKTAKLLKDNFNIKYFSATPMSLNACYSEQKENFLDKQQVTELISRLIKIRNNLNIKVDVFESLVSCVIPEEVLAEDGDFSRRSCTAGRTVAAIGSDGNVRPCSHAPMSYGNLLSESFEQIWQKMLPWRLNEYVPNQCIQCSYFIRCKGGCRISALAANNDICSPDPWMVKPLYIKPPKQKEITEIDFTSQFKMYNIKWRQEGEDRYLFYNPKHRTILQVNNDFFKFIIALKNLGSFVPNNLIEDFHFLKNELQHALLILINRKFIYSL